MDAKARLERFAAAVGGEGFETGLLTTGEGAPYDTLVVAVGEDEASYRLELSFVPGMEEELEGVSILQAFAAVASDVDAARAPDLQRLVALLNTRLPLVGFAHLERERIAGFRHLVLLPADEATATALAVQAVWLVSFLLARFGPAVAAVARGETTVEQALAATPHAAVFR
jgi:hypothetical protein